MKRFKLLSLFILLVAVLAACTTELTQTEGTTESAQIEFARGLSLGEVSNFVRDNNLDVEYMLFTQTIGGEETVGGLLVEGKDADSLEATWAEMDQGFTEDMASTEEGEEGTFTTLAQNTTGAASAPKITGITGNFSKAETLELKSN